MTTKKKKDLCPFYEGMDPEIRETLLKVHEDRKACKLKAPPRKAGDCHLLEDLCLYVFKLAHLDGACQILKKDCAVRKWVWFGHEFTDKMVNVVKEIAPQIADKDELEELRLVATRVTENGIQRLRRIFPKSQVKVYTDEDDKKNWQLSQA